MSDNRIISRALDAAAAEIKPQFSERYCAERAVFEFLKSLRDDGYAGSNVHSLIEWMYETVAGSDSDTAIRLRDYNRSQDACDQMFSA